MEDELRNKFEFFKIENLLAILEMLLLTSIAIFYVMYFETHPPAMTCDVQITQTWVSVFSIIYSVICFLPLFIYGFVRRNKVKLISPYSFIRLGIIVAFNVAEKIHSRGCRAYISPVQYRTVLLIALITPISFLIVLKLYYNQRLLSQEDVI